MAKLNLEQTYYISQIVAVIAIVASLFYVGEQLRLNTREQRVDAWITYVDKWYDFSIVLAKDTELIKLRMRGDLDYESLNDLDKRRYLFIVTAEIEIWQQAFIMHKEGMVDWINIENFKLDVIRRMKLPGCRKAWNEFRMTFNPGFRGYIDEITRHIQD